MHRSLFRIYETQLDSYGHLNHARYLELYEQARWDWLADKGLGREWIMKKGIGPVILNVNVQYRKEVLARQEIEIRTQMARYEKKIFVIQQEMRHGEELLSSAEITGGLMHFKERKLVVPDEEWLEAFEVG